MVQYTVIWIEDETRRQLKKIAVEKEISMRELASTVINDWINSERKRIRNVTPTQPAEVQTKKTPDS